VRDGIATVPRAITGAPVATRVDLRQVFKTVRPVPLTLADDVG